MDLVVDTSVWSLVLRRKQVDESHSPVRAFREHVSQGDAVHLIGNILQELLDGVKSPADFEKLLHLLKPFPLIPIEREMYIAASQLRNQCRKKGIQASPIDFLIAAVCISCGYPLLTTDGDFSYIAQHSELQLVI